MFYDNLALACQQNGMKIATVVKECGGAVGSIDGWKKGAIPRSDIVAKLSLRLNVTTDFLIFGKTRTDTFDLSYYAVNDIAAPSAENTSISGEEKEVLSLMSTLNDEGIKQLLKQARYIASDDEYKKGAQPDVAKEA